MHMFFFPTCFDDHAPMYLRVVHFFVDLQGWFPSNYVEKFLRQEREDPTLTSPTESSAHVFARVLFDLVDEMGHVGID
jgi:hypothetical protein